VHSVSLHAWWQITQFCQNKIATAGLSAGNCQRQLPAPELPWQFRELVLKLPPRKGLQRKSFWRSQKIEAESPVFLRSKKMRPNSEF
jgi:hypothetical protein